jgi:hypothetical protein
VFISLFFLTLFLFIWLGNAWRPFAVSIKLSSKGKDGGAKHCFHAFLSYELCVKDKVAIGYTSGVN